MTLAANQVWLPSYMSFLSGLPETARRRRVLVPYQVASDDSGGKGHDRHFVIAGLAAPAESWAAFSDEWRACLDAEPKIRTFKMREAAARRGQFNRWTKAQRDEKVLSLVRIINRYAEVASYSVIDLEAHAKSWGVHTDKPRNEPYFYPFHNTISAMCFSLWDAGLRERFEAIFDEQVIFGPRAKIWYPVMRAVLKHREPDAATILPVEPVFRDDEDFLPIQAADLFAWCIRRNTSNPSSQVFEWLLPELRDISLSEYSQYYDLERMNSVTEMTRNILREGGVPEEITAEFRKITG